MNPSTGQTQSFYFVLCTRCGGFLWLAQPPFTSEVSLIDNVADDGDAMLEMGKPMKLEELGSENDVGSDGSGINAYGPISLFARGAGPASHFNFPAKESTGFSHSLFKGTSCIRRSCRLAFTAIPPSLSASAREVASCSAPFDLPFPLPL